MLGLNGHVVVHSLDPNFGNYDAVATNVRAVPGVKYALPLIEGQVMVTARGVAGGARVGGYRAEDIQKKKLLRENLQKELIKGYESIRMAEILAGSIRLENESMKLPMMGKLNVKSKSIMGVHIPRLEGGQNKVYEEYLLELPTSINEAISSFNKIHKIVLEVAEKETALRKLLYEIERTKRKSNAIENVFIPRLMNAVKFITFRLDEIERDTFIMLKTVKRKMGEREMQEITEVEPEINV